MTVFVVRYDHPDYSQGIEGVFTNADAAVEAITEAFRIEGFTEDHFTREEVGDELHVFAGVGNADGIFYYVHRETVTQ